MWFMGFLSHVWKTYKLYDKKTRLFKREGNGQGLSVEMTPPFPPASQPTNRGGGNKAMMQAVRKGRLVGGMRRKDG